MPNLPTLTINDQATWNRVFAAFNGDPAAYKAWLRNEVRQYVSNYEITAQAEKSNAELKTAMDAAT